MTLTHQTTTTIAHMLLAAWYLRYPLLAVIVMTAGALYATSLGERGATAARVVDSPATDTLLDTFDDGGGRSGDPTATLVYEPDYRIS